MSAGLLILTATYCLSVLSDIQKVDTQLKALVHQEESVRARAAFELGKIRIDPDRVIPALINALSDPDDYVRERVSEALGALYPDSEPHLLAALRSKESDIKTGAIVSLGLVKTPPDRVLTAIHSVLEDRNPTVRDAAVTTLISYRDKRSIPVLLKCVRVEQDMEVRAAIFLALANFGEKARAAVPLLIEALSEEYQVSSMAQLALRSIGKDAVPALRKAFEDRNKAKIRYSVAYCLAEIGPDAAPAVGALTKGLSDADPEVRHWAAYALGNIGEGARRAVPDLIRLIGTESEKNRIR
jgi:HEAT repeat protein